MNTATPTTPDAALLADALQILRGLVLGAAARVCEVVVTRTSLLGFDVTGFLHGADLEEVAALLASLRGRVQAALALAGGALRRLYNLTNVGRFVPEYGFSRSARKPVARIRFVPSAPLSTKEITDIISTATLFLRDALLAASRVGEFELRVMAF